MLRLKILFGFSLALLLLTPLLARDQSLARGQVIKQSFSFAQTESLAQNGFDLAHTGYPCGDAADLGNSSAKPFRARAEEPPFFYLPAAFLLKFSSAPAWFWPYCSFLFLVAGIAYLASGLIEFSPDERMVIFFGASFIPVFFRYSVQFLPDLQASAFLVWGAALSWRGKKAASVSSFILAVSLKTLSVFALPFLLWKPSAPKKSLFAIIAIVSASLVSFVAWIGFLEAHHIPSPFVLNGILNNRHSGRFHYLWDLSYYERVLLWAGPRGIGWVFIARFRLWASNLKAISFDGNRTKTRALEHGRFALLGFSPRGKLRFTDYYFLPFALPFAILGVIQICKTFKSAPVAKYAAIVLSIALGLESLLSQKPISYPDNPEHRPIFCGMETSDLISQMPK